jgi:hypothetical protein
MMDSYGQPVPECILTEGTLSANGAVVYCVGHCIGGSFAIEEKGVKRKT